MRSAPPDRPTRRYSVWHVAALDCSLWLKLIHVYRPRRRNCGNVNFLPMS